MICFMSTLRLNRLPTSPQYALFLAACRNQQRDGKLYSHRRMIAMEWFMNWWWATVLGPVILGGAIAYALINRRRLTLPERKAQARAVDDEYRNKGE